MFKYCFKNKYLFNDYTTSNFKSIINNITDMDNYSFAAKIVDVTRSGSYWA